MLATAQPATAWPEPTYAAIFASATRILPEPLRELLEDMDAGFQPDCSEAPVGEAVARAIEEFRTPTGDLNRAVGALQDAGCAIAAMNDPGMDSLVASQQQNFVVVFYGWHPKIQEGNLSEYLQVRDEERRSLADRFGRAAQLPSLSDDVETSPEFGIAAIAFSHAVTDVANVWLYVWRAVNGALG